LASLLPLDGPGSDTVSRRQAFVQLIALGGLTAVAAGLCRLMDLIYAWKAVDAGPAWWFAVAVFTLSMNCSVTASIWIADFFVRFSLPSSYFRIRGFERSGRVYERLGVRAARRVFRLSPAVRFSGQRQSLNKLERDMRLAEKHHALSLIVIVIVAIYIQVTGRLGLTLGLLIFGVALQAYPVMLQRYNRGRLIRLYQPSGGYNTSHPYG